MGSPFSSLLTLAGRSNVAPLAPAIYEYVWRPRALALMTGQVFSLARELALIGAWAQIQPGTLVLDIGTSTGFYARGLARTTDDRAQIVGIDHAPGMLAFGKRAARREGLRNVAFIRAYAQTLPFPDASADVVVCGGSLNEFRSMREALGEMARVSKPGARIVTMSLLAAKRGVGKPIQGFFGLSGIRFPTAEAFEQDVRASGLTIVRQQTFGIVTFSRIEKNDNEL